MASRVGIRGRFAFGFVGTESRNVVEGLCRRTITCIDKVGGCRMLVAIRVPHCCYRFLVLEPLFAMSILSAVVATPVVLGLPVCDSAPVTVTSSCAPLAARYSESHFPSSKDERLTPSSGVQDW